MPLIVQEEYLIINIGFVKGMTLPFSLIKECKLYEGPEQISSSEKKYTFEALVSDFIPEKPAIELVLKEPVKSEIIYGFRKKVTRVVIKVDDSDELKRE